MTTEPKPPRKQRRIKGLAETAVLRDLRKMSEDLRKGGVAAAALLLAIQLDEGGTIPRDAAEQARSLAGRLDEGDMTPGEAAGSLRLLARYIEGGMTPRDAAGHAREMRMCMTQLRDWNPGDQEGDATDAARAKMENTRGLYAVEDPA